MPRVPAGIGRRLFSVPGRVQLRVARIPGICDRMVGKCYKFSKLKSVFVAAFIYIEGCLSKLHVVLNHRIKYILLSVLTQKSLFEVVEEESRRQRIAKFRENSLPIRLKFVAHMSHRRQYVSLAWSSWIFENGAEKVANMKTNSATLVFFLFSNLGPGILPSKNGMKSPGPRLFSSTPPFHFPRS